jgi:hypothetical protein
MSSSLDTYRQRDPRDDEITRLARENLALRRAAQARHGALRSALHDARWRIVALLGSTALAGLSLWIFFLVPTAPWHELLCTLLCALALAPAAWVVLAPIPPRRALPDPGDPPCASSPSPS